MSFTLPEPMRAALALADLAAEAGEVPVGAVITRGADIIGTGHNLTRTTSDPTAHAEIVAIREACAALGQDRLAGCVLWATLEPCAMCAAAIAHARLARLIYAAADPKGGAVDHGPRMFQQATCHHRPEVIAGIGETLAAVQLKTFFANRR